MPDTGRVIDVDSPFFRPLLLAALLAGAILVSFSYSGSVNVAAADGVDASSPARDRLYRAQASALFVLDTNDRRIAVTPW